MDSFLVAALMLLSVQQQPANVRPSPATVKSGDEKGKSYQPTENRQNKEADKPTESDRGSSLDNKPKIEAEESGSKKQPHDLLYQAYLWATIIGVSGGFVGLVFIWLQIRAARASAEAAVKSANALMNAERAWIVVVVRGTGYEWRPDNNATEIALFNFGKTPAMIKELLVKTEPVRSIQDVRGSAQEGTILEEVKDVLLAPNEPFAIPIKVPQSMDSPVAVRGIIKYSDVNRRSWCTRFLYLCNFVRLDEPIVFRRIPHGYYNSYGQGYQNEEGGNFNSKKPRS